MTRVTSDFFVASLLRRVNNEGGFAVLERRGAFDAGSIGIKIEREDKKVALLMPAAQSFYETERPQDRLFEIIFDFDEALKASERVQREIKRDPDLWVIDIIDKQGRFFVNLV